LINFNEVLTADFIKKLNIPNEYLDIIMSCQSLCCLFYDEQQKLFREIDRILKKGGKIIFFENKTHRLYLRKKNLWNIDDMKLYYKNWDYFISVQMKLPKNNYICLYEKN